jgi:peptidoglycan/LPS O-acetylase OafA/YrhL
MVYRQEVDGLRGVAVLVIVLFHAGFEPFRGGFVGVDIFFVISGYLITSILLAENQVGALNLKGFYARRIIRIFPALIVNLFVISFVFAPIVSTLKNSNYMISDAIVYLLKNLSISL